MLTYGVGIYLFRMVRVTPNTHSKRDTVNVPRFFYVRI